MLRHAPVTAGKAATSIIGGGARQMPMPKRESPAGPVHHRFAQTSCAGQRKAEIGQTGDAFEREADRIADAVVGGGGAGAGAAFEPNHGSTPALQRQEGGEGAAKEKKPGDADKYKEAAKKAGEAFLETDVGKELKKKAETLGKDFIASLAGKIMTGTAVTGAITAIIATNSELPVGIPEIPLDKLHPGLKMKLTYEGPVRNPTKVMVGFSVPLGRGKEQPKKKTLSKAERYRQETARMRKELNDFRQGLKSPEERKKEDDAFWKAYWGGMNKYGLKPLGIPGLDEKEKPNLLKMRRKPLNGAAGVPSVPASVPETLSRPGRPLDEGVRGLMRRRLGVDLGHVRIHADAGAARSARGVAAQAYTVGHHVVFGAGRYQPRTKAGQRLIAHELTHVVQQAGLTPVARSDAPPAMQRKPNKPKCDVRHPEDCVTYEDWVQSFALLPTFEAKTGHDVIGKKAASQDPKKPAEERPPPPYHKRATDRFIDRPTDAWVKKNLPANLRDTAYRLPADCADMTVILRHVWLSAHHRQEGYVGRDKDGKSKTWTVGDFKGGARATRVRKVIKAVDTPTMRPTVMAYEDDAGKRLRSFNDLDDLLHPGDIMVWEHVADGRRTGGHAQTIQTVQRNKKGDLTRIKVLQGNQPIFQDRAQEIRQKEKDADRSPPSESALRNAPGRRIERSRRAPPSDRTGVWKYSHTDDEGNIKTTRLVMAGPSKSARRPAVRRRRKKKHVNTLLDWLGSIRKAVRRTLQGIFEGVLVEARARIEGGGKVPEDHADKVGTATGERLWQNAKKAGDLGSESHFRPLRRMQATVRRFRDNSRKKKDLTPTFNRINRTMTDGARGYTSVDFKRKRARRGTKDVKILMTGFDPFYGRGQKVPAGYWNPSGAAVLALDGKTYGAGRGVRAVIEGMILPVSFRAFDKGVVERVVGPHLDEVDAVMTVSMAGFKPNEPVAIERFAVGARLKQSGKQPVPVPVTSGVTRGPAIIETKAPVDALDKKLGKGAIVRNTITLRFSSKRKAAALEKQVPGAVANGRDVEIGDLKSLRTIVSSMTHPNAKRANRVKFAFGGKSFTADVVSGPGGDFLSNEVSYRVLRLIRQRTGAKSPVSFHTHTQKGTPIRGSGKEKAAATKEAKGVRTRLIGTLKTMAKALAARLARATRGGGP